MEKRKKISVTAILAIKATKAKWARLHFRAAVRLVYENHNWLEDTEGEQLGMNVARNIQILTMKKGKGEFTLKEKAIMKVKQGKRTEEEKKHLRKVLGSLKFFRKYPSDVKTELATITYFVQYEAERTIMREGDPATAVFFVVSGSARVVVNEWDPLLGKYEKLTVNVKEAGEILGELAILLGGMRSATIITNERTEMVFILKKDFERVLKKRLLQEWEDIKNSMAKFDYFKSYDERYLQQSCMVSKMRYYAEHNLILSQDYGDSRFVYFLIEGTVELVECLEVLVHNFRNKKNYKLYNTYFPSSPFTEKPNESSTKDLMSSRLDQQKTYPDLKKASDSSKKRSTHSVTSTFLKNYFSKSANKKMKKTLLGKPAYKKYDSVKKNGETDVIPDDDEKKFVYEVCLRNMEAAERVQFVKKFESRKSRVACPKEVPKDTIETHFIRVATMSPLATFNIGEHLDSRYYVAKSNVKLLAIPKYWLLTRDLPTWNNIIICLRTRLPTRQQLFDEFINEKSWISYRKKVYEEIVERTKKCNTNCINNVPLSIRLDEDVDYHVQSRDLPKERRKSSNKTVSVE